MVTKLTLNPTTMPLPKKLQDKQDKEWHYTWLHKEGRYHINDILLRGYEMCNISNTPDMIGDPRIEKGKCVHGDMMLGRVKTVEFIERMQSDSNKRKRRIRQTTDDL